jgi:putative MFS transporter
LSDRFGRKIIYLVDMSLLGAAALLFAFAPNFPLMILCQFLIGTGIGMDFPVSSSYISGRC